MLLGAWVVGLVLLALFFERFFEREENPNPNPVMSRSADGSPEVVLKRNRAGHFVATGSINGVAVRFLVDTGATDVALSRGLARQLDLPLRPGGQSMTANGMVDTWSTRLDRVELGGLVARQVRASVLPRLSDDDVLLGMSYLKHLEMIQRGDLLILRPQDGG